MSMGWMFAYDMWCPELDRGKSGRFDCGTVPLSRPRNARLKGIDRVWNNQGNLELGAFTFAKQEDLIDGGRSAGCESCLCIRPVRVAG